MSETYKGFYNVKRAGVRHDFTSEQIEEFMKCAADVTYFLRTYVKVNTLDDGVVQFKPYEYQLDVVKAIEENRFTILKWPRRYGKTTIMSAYILWSVLFNESYSVAVLAHKHDMAREILSTIQMMYTDLPSWLQQGVSEWSKGTVEFENRSSITTAATSPGAVRGRGFNWIYLDEFAHVDSNIQEAFYESAFPTITSGQTTRLTISSTPKGMNYFYKIWVDSEDGNNDFKRHEVHWSDMPGRDEAWKREMIKNTSEDQFSQEFECNFLGSSNTLIHPEKLRQLRQMKPIQESINGKIFHAPKKGDLYAIIVDTGTGGGGDYSAFIVFNISRVPYEVCYVYRSKFISPYLYPNIIHDVAKQYNNAQILIETQVGQQVADILHFDLEYEYLISTITTGRSGQMITSGFGGGGAKFGIHTSRSVKRIGCSNLKSLIESDKLIVNDYDIIYELSRFVDNNRGSFEAEEGHDDLAMCLVLFSWLTSQEYFKDFTNISVREHLLSQHQALIEEDVAPFGFIDIGYTHEEVMDDMNNTSKYFRDDEFTRFIMPF